MDFEITYGAQAGAEGKVFNKKAGADVNLISMVLYSLNVTGEAGLDGTTNGTTESYYFGENNVDRLTQSVSGSLGLIQGAIERTWEPSEANTNEQIKMSGGVLIFEGEHTISENPIQNPTRANSHIGMRNFGAKIGFLIGIEFNVRLGISHD